MMAPATPTDRSSPVAALAPRWVSTRSPQGEAVSFIEALSRGLAPDGGLYVPITVPALPKLRPGSAFGEVARACLSPWISGLYPEPVWRAAVTDALSFDVPLVTLDGPTWRGVHVLELFHGPTCSFKDFGARTMARLLAASAQKADAHVFVATSGDTGSAVADGFSGLPGFRVVLLYPEGQVSPVQERQLALRREGVAAFRVRGTFDDCQALAKGVFADQRFRYLAPTSANSINAGRLLPQMLYYVHAANQLGTAPWFCVPSGNLGNLTAGVFAMLGGMDTPGFVAAHNANDSFARFLGGATARFGPSVRTLSNAMDVGAPSNFERLTHLLGPTRLRSLVHAEVVGDEDTLRCMRAVHDETGYVCDPHTAVGLEAARRLRQGSAGESRPIVVLSTAHPAKFPEVVRTALGFDPAEPPALAALLDRPERVRTIDPTQDALLAALREQDFSA